MRDEIRPIDRLFVAKAVQKRICAIVDDLKRECDRDMVEDYLETGNTQRRSPLLGKAAGTYTVPISEAKPGGQRVEWRVADKGALKGWMDANLGACASYCLAHAEDFAETVLEGTGEMLPGLDRLVTQTEGVGESIGTPRLSVREDAVFDRLAELGYVGLGGADRFLLGDGHE